MNSLPAIAGCAFLATAATTSTIASPVTYEQGAASLTVEAFANVTSGITDGDDALNIRDGDLRVDGALRLLGRLKIQPGLDIGARIVARTSLENQLELGETSFLVFGGAGRLEFGDRQGLPDVLLGYAPNNFTFTGAEFGPASGPSLDPGGGLQTAFLSRDLAAQLSDLTALGFTASLAGDESGKVLYVSPKRRGFLAGVSYRTSTHLRFYGAYYYYDFDDEGGASAADRHDGGVLLFGIRLSL